MSAIDWNTDSDKSQDFEGYGGHLTLASIGPGSLYFEINPEFGQPTTLLIEPKEIMRIAHWIIKEHG